MGKTGFPDTGTPAHGIDTPIMLFLVVYLTVEYFLCRHSGGRKPGNTQMSLDRTDVDKIAHLARLAVSDEEKDRYATDLSKILGLVEQMSAVDTDDVTPMAHPLHMVQRLRVDEPSEPNQRELFQQIAPATEDGLYLVPKVIE